MGSITTIKTVKTLKRFCLEEDILQRLIANHLRLPINELRFEWDCTMDFDGLNGVDVLHETTETFHESSEE